MVAFRRVTSHLIKREIALYNCYSCLLIVDSHYISSTFSRYRFQIRENVFGGNTGDYFSLKNDKNILLQLFFLYFSPFVESKQILLSEDGMGMLRAKQPLLAPHKKR